MKRFNKDTLIKDLWVMANANIETMQQEHNRIFKIAEGYTQVVGKGEAVNRSYQEIRTILNIIELIQDGLLGRSV